MIIGSGHKSRGAVEAFVSYSHKDEELRRELDAHLSLLKRDGLVSAWHDRQIGAGQDFNDQIKKQISTARIILLLVSADFIASDYCVEVEMNIALERHERGEARVIPVILRPTDWETSRLGQLLALPTDAKPVTSPLWSSRDEAFLDVVKAIRKVIQNLENTEANGGRFNEKIPDGLSDVYALLQLCKRGLPGDVLATVFGGAVSDLHSQLEQSKGPLIETRNGIWTLARAMPGIKSAPAVLISKALDELLEFIRTDKGRPERADQAWNAIDLARECSVAYPNSAAKLFLRGVDKVVKDLGNKRLLFDIANLSIQAARRSTNRTQEVVKGEAIALVCGKSWVLQRMGRLTEALADAEESLRLGERIPWERNTAFCKKCIGRLYRMLAEEELERTAPDQGRVKRLLEDSITFLTEAIRRFSGLEEVGPTHPEVGDCYSLMGRTCIVASKMSDADGAIKKAFKLIPEGSGKDYLDLLILAGDFQVKRGNRQDAELFYNSALKIKNENAEMTEMQARAHFARGLNREAMKQFDGAVKDISKAYEILKGLGEIRAASRMRWELHRIQGQIPSETLSLLKPETYTTRILAIERYTQMKGETKKKPAGSKVVGRRSAMSAQQLKQIIKEARAQADQEEPKW